MKTKNQYPDWGEKYRSKGHTIRKVRDGYGLYKCTSVYIPGASYPKSKQVYLGMITEDEGFIPKKTTLDHPTYIEYGLSNFIWLNFKRDIKRSAYDGDEILARLGIIMYIFGSVKPVMIKASYISDGIEDVMIERSLSSSIKRIKTVANKIDKIMAEKISDIEDRYILESLLRLCVMESNNRSAQSPAIPDEAKEIIERNGLKYAKGKT